MTRRAAVAVAALAILAALAVLAAELARPTSAAAAQAPSVADPAQIVRIHNGVYLYWHEPASGAGITGYDIQYRSGTSGAWGTWTDAGFSGTVQPAVVTGLAAGTTYQFRVRAGNAGGKGAWSEAPDADDDPARVVTVAASASGVPNTVKSVAAEAGDAQIAVTWTVPHARTGVTITGYTVFWGYYDEDDNGHSDSARSIAAAGSSYTITGLVNGRAYGIWVRAQASGKTSRDSMLVYDITPQGGGSAATPTPTPTATPTPTPKPGPKEGAAGGLADDANMQDDPDQTPGGAPSASAGLIKLEPDGDATRSAAATGDGAGVNLSAVMRATLDAAKAVLASCVAENSADTRPCLEAYAEARAIAVAAEAILSSCVAAHPADLRLCLRVYEEMLDALQKGRAAA